MKSAPAITMSSSACRPSAELGGRSARAGGRRRGRSRRRDPASRLSRSSTRSRARRTPACLAFRCAAYAAPTARPRPALLQVVELEASRAVDRTAWPIWLVHFWRWPSRGPPGRGVGLDRDRAFYPTVIADDRGVLRRIRVGCSRPRSRCRPRRPSPPGGLSGGGDQVSALALAGRRRAGVRASIFDWMHGRLVAEIQGYPPGGRRSAWRTMEWRRHTSRSFCCDRGTSMESDMPPPARRYQLYIYKQWLQVRGRDQAQQGPVRVGR